MFAIRCGAHVSPEGHCQWQEADARVGLLSTEIGALLTVHMLHHFVWHLNIGKHAYMHIMPSRIAKSSERGYAHMEVLLY